jgi:class 3 adenylate cyclase
MNGLLIVDDEEGVRRALHKALAKENYQIYSVGDGNEAIDLVKQRLAEISIVISDFKMPGIDGLQTLVAIGNINPDITRILLTGYATLESAIAATNEGIDGFLTKPFDNVELRSKVREYSIRKYLRQFVSAQVLNELQADPNQLLPRKQVVTILFVGIRGFTNMIEQHDPGEWAAFLGVHYFSPLGEIIFHNNGTLDKHIGDTIMSIYGAPNSSGDDAWRAVKAAVELRAKMIEINNGLELADRLPVSFGLDTGEVVVGMFGSARKKEYTALGHSVNLSNSLQEMAQPGQILITEKTYQAVKERITSEALPPVQIRGMSGPVNLYNVTGLS